MFRFANKKDKENLYQLWNECFGDGKEFVFPFLDCFLKEDNVYVFEDSGKIVSAVYALDCRIGDKKCAYFYAVATNPEYRRRGLAETEIKFLIDYKSQRETEAFLLTASSEKNRCYYEKLGFSDAFFALKKKIFAADSDMQISENFNTRELYSLREKAFEKNKFVSFDEKHFSFAVNFSERIFVEKEGGQAVSYALMDSERIIEAASIKNTEKFVAKILYLIGKNEMEIFIPEAVESQPFGCKTSRGMVYCFDKNEIENFENIFLSLNLE